MIDLNAVAAAFPELSDITFIVQSGQRLVFGAYLSGRRVALKVLKEGQNLDRIIREPEAVSRLGSDFIPEIVDSGDRVIAGVAWPYLIEQYIDGRSYRTVLTARPVQPVTSVLTLGRQLLRACTAFEEHRIVHRDIKPENIMLDAGDKAWILDFGIVRLLDWVSVTGTNDAFGPFTPGYAAPEQVRNRKDDIDSRADLFSVGVVLYEAFNGSNPYRANKRSNLEIIDHVCNQDLPRLALDGDEDGSLSEFIATLVSRFPSRRPQTTSDALAWHIQVSERWHARRPRSL